MSKFKKCYQTEFSLRLFEPHWRQRCWLAHLPKKIDWSSFLVALARFGQRYHAENRAVFWGHSLGYAESPILSERLATQLADFRRLERLRRLNWFEILRELVPDQLTTVVYAGMSAGPLQRDDVSKSDQELLSQIIPGLANEDKLCQQLLAVRHSWLDEAQLLIQDQNGRFLDFNAEQETVRAIRRGRRVTDLTHFGAFSLSVKLYPLGQGDERISLTSSQFSPHDVFDLDAVTEVVAMLAETYRELSPNNDLPYVWLECEGLILSRMLLTECLKSKLSTFDRILAPALVFGPYPLVSFSEFLAWTARPRIFLSLSPRTGELSFALIVKEQDS